MHKINEVWKKIQDKHIVFKENAKRDGEDKFGVFLLCCVTTTTNESH